MRELRKLLPLWQRARTGVLTVTGFSGLSAAAWTAWGTAAGLAVSGASCLIVEALSGEDK